MPTTEKLSTALAMFMDKHRMPNSYKSTCERWFLPLADRLAALAVKRDSPLIVGINGAQGSGKSTLAELLEMLLNDRQIACVSLSIDDFYHTAAERHHLGDAIHPLLETRGVPGTHDLHLAHDTLDNLLKPEGSAILPRFDKANDDRFPLGEWQTTTLPVDVILIEGWCMGTTPQLQTELQTPVNDFEANEDHDGQWRRFVNDQLKEFYYPFFNRIDYWIMLRAPSFDCIYDWRLEQEQKLAANRSGDKIMSAEQVKRFVAHYERLTRHNLKYLAERMNEVFDLNDQRQIIDHFCNQQD